MTEKIVTIGAGTAGLAARYNARMNGYAAEIYEAHTLPGGPFTFWQCKRFTIGERSTTCSGPGRAKGSTKRGGSWGRSSGRG